MVRVFFLLGLLIGTLAYSESIRVYHVGNSYTWDALDSAKGFPALLESQGIDYQYDYHIRCGRSLSYIWAHPEETCVDPVRQTFVDALTENEWDVVTLQPYRDSGNGTTTLETEVQAIVDMIELTRSNPLNQDTHFILQAAWPELSGAVDLLDPSQSYLNAWLAPFSIDEGTPFQLNRDSLRLLYLGVKERVPEGVHVSMNPAGWVLAEVERRILRGELDYSGIGDFYRDPLHMSLSHGRWLIANALYSAIFDESPEGIPIPEIGVFGEGIEGTASMSEDQALALQQVAWEVVKAKPQEFSSTPVRVVLVMGQSNAVGGGTWGDLDLIIQNAVQIDLMSCYEEGLGRIVDDTNLHMWSAYDKFGPEVGLSSVFKRVDSQLCILKYAVGGTGLAEHWNPDAGSDERSRYGLFDKWLTFYNESITQLLVLGLEYEIVGMVWMQGESDAIWGDDLEYEANLSNFINRCREAINLPELPILVGRIHQGLSVFNSTTQEQWQQVRKGQMRVANEMEHCWWLNTDLCQRKLLNTNNHYDTQGSFDLGVLFGEALNVILERGGMQSAEFEDELVPSFTNLGKELSFIGGADFLSANQAAPMVEVKSSDSGPAISVRQRILTGSVDSELQWSSDLISWGPGDQWRSKLVNADPTDGLVRFEVCPVSNSETGSIFMRQAAAQDSASLLRRWQERKQLYLDGEIDHLNVVVIGDSWVHNPVRLTEPLRDLFKEEAYEDGGVGYVNFGWYRKYDSHMDLGADRSLLSGNKTTGWDTEYSKTHSIAGSHIYSSQVGESITLDLKESHEYGEIHYYAHPGGGAFRYRVAGGDWYLISTDDAAGYQTTEMVGVNGVTGLIEIEVASVGSEGVVLIGAYFRKNEGVVINKCGRSGATAATFLTNIASGVYSPAFETLQPDLVVMLLGTNEHISNHPAHTPYQFHLRIKGLIDRTRVAAPAADHICVVPAVNAYDSEKNYSMLDYRDVYYYTANLNGAAFVDLTEIFGEYDSYKYDPEGHTLGWFIEDGKHPSVEGGKVIAESIYDLLK